MADLLARLQGALGDAYRIERELGGGGMSRLFLATEVSLHRQVVIKVLPPELASEISATRFKQEVELAAHLQHPNILPILTAAAKGELLFYVMPYVSGESLRHRLTRDGKLPVPDALRILQEVADALAHAHSEGVIHRDIKPENILLEGDHAVLTDFGVARAVADARSGERLTDTGLALGTPGYMSPEQAAGERHIDARADVYSLAVVGYEMLAGVPPFAAPTAREVLAAHLTATPNPLTDLRPEAPAEAANAIMQALAKDPAARLRTGEFRDALREAYRGAPPVRRGWPVLAAAVAAVVVAVGALVLRSDGAQAVIPSAATIAVMPLAPSAPDTALARLGRDLVITLSANLDGVGDIRTVDALTVLAQVRESGMPLSLDQGLRLGRRLNASSVLHGSLVRMGNGVRLEAGLFAIDRATPVARVTVTASGADVTALTDSATWALLRQVWRTREPPTPSIADVTTRSLPALRAFLEGERSILENRWQAAADAFSRAMESDSTFWLAYRRYVYSRNWILKPVDGALIAAYREHRRELPDRERLFIEATMSDSLSVRLSRLAALTERYPDYWPAWFFYADRLVHDAPLLGVTRVEAQAALEQTLALNPNLTPAWQHLVWVTMERDTATAARAVAAYMRLGGGTAFAADFGVDDARMFRLQLHARRTGNTPAALVDSIASDLVRAQTQELTEIFLYHLADQGFPQAQIELNRRVLRATPAADLARKTRRAVVHAWAARGAWDSVLVAQAEAGEHAADEAALLDAYRLAVIGAWLGALDPATALHRRTGVAAVGRASAAWRAEIAWLDGLLAVVLRDRPSLGAARATLQRTDTATATLLDRSLAAFELEMQGRRRNAASDLAALEWRRPESRFDGYDAHPYLLGVNRLAAARWLLAEGDAEQAARLLLWAEALPPAMNQARASAVLDGLTSLERARAEEARGRTDLARQHYAQFVQRYDMPVAAHRHLLEEAETALAKLEHR